MYEALGYSNPLESANTDVNENENDQIDWGNVKEEFEAAQKAKWSKAPPLIKEFYTEHPEITEKSEFWVQDFRATNNNIVVSNFREDSEATILKPVAEFYQAFVCYPDIMATINAQGFEKPSPIQAQGWPYLLSGKDLIGIAQTGTGKTLAFLLPW